MPSDCIIYLFGMLIFIVLFLGTLYNKEIDSKQRKYFIFILISLFGYLFFCFFSELFEGKENLTILLYILNLISFICIDLAILSFCGYLHSLINQNGPRKTVFVRIAAIATLVRIGIILVIFAVGHLFSIQDGYYVEGDLEFIPYICSAIIMVLLITATIRNSDRFNIREFIVILTYLLIPLVPIVIEMFTELYCLSAISLTVSVLVVYVLIQAVESRDTNLRANILEELSSTDLLTGLLNRRSYYNQINQLESNQNVGVIFSDVNGLKYTNDHFGHTEGDNLLKRFAKVLTNNINRDYIFRISGDEFVIIIPNITKEQFEIILERLKKDIIENNNIAAIGDSYGIGKCVETLISEAEELMYKNKKETSANRPSYKDNR